MEIDLTSLPPPTVFTDADRFNHSVVDVCRTIHDTIVGSSHEVGDRELGALAEWLAWRIGDGWQVRNHGDRLHWRAYDNAVRLLGRRAVVMAMGR